MEEFGFAIKQHLELQARNRLLEAELPIDRYRDAGGAVAAHPVFAPAASEPLEDTQEWSFPDEITVRGEREPLLQPVDELWSGNPSFDWGD
jgi:hypothetical protein